MCKIDAFKSRKKTFFPPAREWRSGANGCSAEQTNKCSAERASGASRWCERMSKQCKQRSERISQKPSTLSVYSLVIQLTVHFIHLLFSFYWLMPNGCGSFQVLRSIRLSRSRVKHHLDSNGKHRLTHCSIKDLCVFGPQTLLLHHSL